MSRFRRKGWSKAELIVGQNFVIFAEIVEPVKNMSF